MPKKSQPKGVRVLAFMLSIMILIGMVPSTAFAQTEKYPNVFTVQVVNNGIPVPGQVVHAFNDDNSVEVNGTTDENGTVALSAITNDPLPSQHYTFEIGTDEASLTECFDVNLESGATQHYTYDLITKALTNIQRVSVLASTPANGTIKINNTQSSPQWVDLNSSVLVQITPNAGYEIQSVKIGGATKTVVNKASYTQTITASNSNTLVDATFGKIQRIITVTPSAGGSIARTDGEDIIDHKVAIADGGDLSFTITANPGFLIKEVDENGSAVAVNQASPYTYVMKSVTKDMTLSAQFSDVQAPVISGVTVLEADTYKKEKTVTFQTSDNTSVKNTYYSKTDFADLSALNAAVQSDPATAWAANSNSFRVTENGKYYIYAIDPSGNMAKASADVVNIDTTAPLIGKPTQVETGSLWWKKVTYSFDVTDEASGIASVFYSLTPGASTGTAAAKGVGNTYNFVVKQNATYYIYAVDNAGNQSSVSTKVDNIDVTSPQVSNPTVQSSWDASSNQVSFTATDNNAVQHVYYATTQDYDTAADKQELTPANGTYSFSVSKNGTYYIFAVDEAGNVGTAAAVVNHIDTTVPTVDSVTKTPAAEWYNGEVEVQVSASDKQSDAGNGSGVEKVVYSSQYSSYADAQTNGALRVAVLDSGKYKFAAPSDEFNGLYYVWAVDSVGRVSTDTSSIVVKIDKTAPSGLKISYVKDTSRGFIKELLHILTFGLFFGDKAVIQMEATDNRTNADSGIAGYEYQLVETGSSLADSNWVKVNSKENSVEAEVPYQNFKGKIYARSFDLAGNKTAAFTDTQTGTTIVMDNESSSQAPKINYNGYTENTWTKNDVEITLSGAETTSGVDYYQYKIDYTDPSLTDVDWTKMTETDGALPHEGGDTIANKITIQNDTNAKYYFRAVSNTLHASAETGAVSIKVQKTTPPNAALTVATPNGKDVGGHATGWYVGSFAAPGIVVDAPVVSQYGANVSTYYKLWNTTRSETENTAQKILFQGGNQPTITADGIYSLKIWTEDEAQNHCANDTLQEIKVDTTAPTDMKITVSGDSIAAKEKNSIAFNLFYNHAITVESSANFDISSMKSLMYQKVKNASDYNAAGTWVNYDAKKGVTVSPSDKFILFFRAEDNAGNSTIGNTDGVIVDDKPPVGEKTAPEIGIVPQAANKNGYYNGDVKVDISVVDPKYNGQNIDSLKGVYSGLKSIHYRVLNNGVETQKSTVLFPISGKNYSKDSDGLITTWDGSITVPAKENNSNNVVVEVTAVDNAGNTKTTKTAAGEIKIDITAPAIQVSYDNNSGNAKTKDAVFFKANRTARIVVTERNFHAEDVNTEIKNSRGAVPKISAWSTVAGTGNGDNTTHTATVTYAADGDYTFAVQCSDLAGNANHGVAYAAGTLAPEKFTIDKTLPVVSVSYSNNSAGSGKYFKAARTATIAVTEHNFDASRMTYTRTSAKDGAKIADPAISSWSKNGDVYTAVIQYNVDGDYTFDLAMDDLAGNKNNGVNYGGSAAPKDFTIDTTIAKPSISGVENGKAYKGDVIPKIVFNDINYDSYKITLLRTRKDEKNVDVTDRFIKEIPTNAKGGEGTCDTFDKTKQDNDGIYTLTVKVTDKAGNEQSDSRTFSVNRFGSVYTFNNYLISLQNSYVQKVKDKLVITEYNPDKLVKGFSNIEVTCDGTPLADVKYKVSPEVNDTVAFGESGWYQYEYDIDTANFTKDGIYKVVVSSQDAAGNKPENTNYKDQEILFRVDTVAPALTNVTGLEQNSVNAEKIEVKLDAFDAIGLKKVTAYVGGKAVKTFEDFKDRVNFSGSFEIGEGMNQPVRIVMEDMAGNMMDTNADGFTTKFRFERNVTVSTNLFVRWYANQWLFWGSIGGVVVLAALLTLLVMKKRKKVPVK